MIILPNCQIELHILRHIKQAYLWNLGFGLMVCTLVSVRFTWGSRGEPAMSTESAQYHSFVQSITVRSASPSKVLGCNEEHCGSYMFQYCSLLSWQQISRGACQSTQPSWHLQLWAHMVVCLFYLIIKLYICFINFPLSSPNPPPLPLPTSNTGFSIFFQRINAKSITHSAFKISSDLLFKFKRQKFLAWFYFCCDY